MWVQIFRKSIKSVFTMFRVFNFRSQSLSNKTFLFYFRYSVHDLQFALIGIFVNCFQLTNYSLPTTYSAKVSREKSFAFRCKTRIWRRKLSRIAPVRPIITWVWPQNLAEKTFADCSGTSNYYVGVATKFFGENFRGLLRYVQLLRGCGHKILRRKLSRIAPVRPIITWVWPQNLAEKTFVDCSSRSNYYVGVATKFGGENFRGLLRYVQLLRGCGHKILRRKLSRIAPVRPIITWVWPQNFAEKTFADCSGTSNYYVGVATKFGGENFHGWF